jgi:hypothetical protein
MKESYREGLASRSGLEPYAGDGNVAGVASRMVQRKFGVRPGLVISEVMHAPAI